MGLVLMLMMMGVFWVRVGRVGVVFVVSMEVVLSSSLWCCGEMVEWVMGWVFFVKLVKC